jgi:histidyl-tRNA synthetase
MKVAKLLWRSNISAEYSHHENPKLKRQLDEALARGVPIMVVFGEEEIHNGTIKVKDIKAHTEEEVKIEDVASVVSQKLRL